MSRNPLIEAIHEARYDLETCARQERAARQKKLEDLLRQALERSGFAAKPDELARRPFRRLP